MGKSAAKDEGTHDNCIVVAKWTYRGTIAAAIIGVFGAITAAAIAAHADSAKDKAIGRAEQLRIELQAKQFEVEQLERRVLEEREAAGKLLVRYRAHLIGIKDAASRYRETKSPEHEQELRNEIRSFVAYVHQWRKTQAALAEILDGHVNRLEAAAGGIDIAEIESLRDILEKGLDDKEPLIDAAIRNLMNPDPTLTVGGR